MAVKGINGPGLTILLIIVAIIVVAPAYAYVDPGTASAVWAFGLAPVVGVIGWIGRNIVRKLLRRGGDEEDKDQDSEQSEQEQETPSE